MLFYNYRKMSYVLTIVICKQIVVIGRLSFRAIIFRLLLEAGRQSVQ